MPNHTARVKTVPPGRVKALLDVPPNVPPNVPSWRSRRMAGALFDVIQRKASGLERIVEAGATIEVAEGAAALLREHGVDVFIRPAARSVPADAADVSGPKRRTPRRRQPA